MALPPKKEKKVVQNENPVLFRVRLLHHKIAVHDQVRVPKGGEGCVCVYVCGLYSAGKTLQFAVHVVQDLKYIQS